MSALPFGLETKAGIQGLEYDRVEAVLTKVPRPHEPFSEYRVTYFRDSDGFNISARTEAFEIDASAVGAYSVVYDELIEKYGEPYGGDDRLDLFYDAGLLPMVNWMFEPRVDGEPKLAWMMLQVKEENQVNWFLDLSYMYRTELLDDDASSL